MWIKVCLFGIGLIARIPLKGLYFISSYILYPLTYYVARYRRRIVSKNLRLSFPEKSKTERKVIEKAFYHHFTDIIVEILFGYKATDEQMCEHMIYTPADKAYAEELIEKYGGCFFLLSHYGNWEWESDISKRFADPRMHLVSIYRQLDNHTMDTILKTIREQRGTTMCEMRDLLRQMIRDSKSERLCTYGMINDQKPSLFSQHYWTTFLHQETAFLDGTERLAQKFKYPIIYVHITMPKRGVYVNTFTVISEHPDQEEQYYITERYARLLEENILECPQLWLWSHNRWKYHKGQHAG